MPAAQRKTPGVYVTEVSAFPPSVVGVETAVPAFIGYTHKAKLGSRSVAMTPVAITSFAEFQQIFGPEPDPDGTFPQDPPVSFVFAEVTKTDPNKPDPNKPDPNNPDPNKPDPSKPDPSKPEVTPVDFTIQDKDYSLTLKPDAKRFYLSSSIRLFYANGGGNCYVVSVGNYDAPVDSKKLIDGLDAIHDQVGPTILVVPDSTLVTTGFADVAAKMLRQCKELGDRVALLDVPGADKIDPRLPGAMDKPVEDFRTAVGTEGLSYGMAYFPFLNTSIYEATDFNYANLDSTGLEALKTALKAVVDPTGKSKDAAVTKMNDKIGKISATCDKALNNDLSAAFPVLKQIYSLMARSLNVLPPSGAMAGVFTYVDNARGVWNAPANISLTSVSGPTFKVTAKTQENLNVPIEGKAINAIRDFVGQGTLVWGARTLDGNSNDYRYIQVRRTLVYVEQSIKAALNPFVFAPNNGQTWVAVTAMISNFLNDLWTQGGLMGAKASEAFSVQCGLGSTMTGLDILNGYLRVQVTLQMIHPAEFIELTVSQKMQGVN
jgi:uncharacterized protein